MCRVDKTATKRLDCSISYKSCMSNRLPCRIIDMGVSLFSILVFVCLVTYIIQEFGEVLLFSCIGILERHGIEIMKLIQLKKRTSENHRAGFILCILAGLRGNRTHQTWHASLKQF
jgi:hypothetical protein